MDGFDKGQASIANAAQELVNRAENKAGFSPEDVRRIFYEVFGNSFDWIDLFYSQSPFYASSVYSRFLLWNNEDTWYVHRIATGTTISWYKNLGRLCVCYPQDLSLPMLKEFFRDLHQDHLESTEHHSN